MTSNLNTMTDGTHRMHVKMIGEMDVDPEEALYVVRTQTFAHHPDETVSFGDRDADTVQLHLDDTPATTLYAGSKVVEMPRGMALECSMRDLRQPLAWRADHRLDMLSFDIPSKALTRWARDNGVRSVGGLSFQDGVRQHDEVIKGFGLALLPFLDDPAFAPRLFVDCVLNAVCSHLVRRFGTTYNIARRAGGLAPWQERRATEMLAANLNGQLSLQALAIECRVSVSHFIKAFRESVGETPHQWLLQRRIERSMELLGEAHMALTEIAALCGFSDQSHFTREFSRRVGAAPGAWRRERLPLRTVDASRGEAAD